MWKCKGSSHSSSPLAQRNTRPRMAMGHNELLLHPPCQEIRPEKLFGSQSHPSPPPQTPSPHLLSPRQSNDASASLTSLRWTGRTVAVALLGPRHHILATPAMQLRSCHGLASSPIARFNSFHATLPAAGTCHLENKIRSSG